MSVTYPLAVVSEGVNKLAAQAWEQEVDGFTQRLPKPGSCNFAKFFPTDACKEAMTAAVSEYSKARSMPDAKSWTTGGFVLFPGKTPVARSFSIMIPLCIIGAVKMEGTVLDMDHHYHVQKETLVEVSENAKIVMLLVSDVVWS